MEELSEPLEEAPLPGVEVKESGVADEEVKGAEEGEEGDGNGAVVLEAEKEPITDGKREEVRDAEPLEVAKVDEIAQGEEEEEEEVEVVEAPS